MATKKKSASKAQWVHVGGGTNIPIRGKYPCDDEYEKSGIVVIVHTTYETHFSGKMPNKVRRIADLGKIEGVKLPT